ncbi:MAG: hypothetical protein JSR67_14405 [Proteobacteria bacterium]|nr:hypothetical protein [Pseudomonadota bacterium]
MPPRTRPVHSFDPFRQSRRPLMIRHTPTVAFLRCLLSLAALRVSAQGLPTPPRTPDLVGIHTGMPALQAQATLQKRTSSVAVQHGGDSQLQLTIPDPKNPDIITVYMTQPPNDPFVWRVTRQWIYYPGAGGPGMTEEALLAGLRAKYGNETLAADQASGAHLALWIFDRDGRLKASADPALQGCEAGNFAPMMATGVPQQPNDLEKTCFAAFFAVKASINLRGPLIDGYSVELVNLPYAWQAALNVTNANSRAAGRARQDQLNRASQNTPTF